MTIPDSSLEYKVLQSVMSATLEDFKDADFVRTKILIAQSGAHMNEFAAQALHLRNLIEERKQTKTLIRVTWAIALATAANVVLALVNQLGGSV